MGLAEYAKSTFGVFSAVPTCLADSGLMRCVTWPDANGLSAWEKLDSLQPHQLRHNLVKDLHVFGSYVRGHLPREHPHVADTTHDDRAEEGVFLGNDLTTPNFWMYSFVLRR
jgi:hypothetical protein